MAHLFCFFIIFILQKKLNDNHVSFQNDCTCYHVYFTFFMVLCCHSGCSAIEYKEFYESYENFKICCKVTGL
jgi:hypothetical protein